MQNPLQITFHDLKNNQDIETLIHERFEKLKGLSSDITKCHVVIEKLSKHHIKGNQANVRLDLKVAHYDDIVVTEKCEADDASLKSTILQVFKRGLVLVREEMKRRKNHKRTPLRDNLVSEKDEQEEE